MCEWCSSHIYVICGNSFSITLKGVSLLNCEIFNTHPITNSPIFNPIFSSFHREGLGSKNWEVHWLQSRRRSTQTGFYTWAVTLGATNSTVADITNTVSLITCWVAVEIKLNLKEITKPFHFVILFVFDAFIVFIKGWKCPLGLCLYGRLRYEAII